MPRSSRHMGLGVLVIAIAATSGACGPSNELPLAAVAAADTKREVVRGVLAHSIVLSGELEATQSEALVAPQTDSWAIAIRWLAEDGAIVKKGDRVVALDNTAILAQISDHELATIQASIDLSSQRATAAVEVADKRFEVATQRTNVAKAELDATVPAELVSVRDRLQFELAEKSAKAALVSAQDDLEASRKGGDFEEQVKRIALDKAKRKLDAASGQIDALELTAPRDGVVLIGTHPWEGRKLQVGDTVWPGMTVAKLPELEEMIVEAQLSDVDDGRVVAGMKARCSVDAYPDRPIEAVVLSVSPVAREPEHQSARRFFSVVLKLNATDAEIMRPGLSVKVEVFESSREDVLLVPRASLDTNVEPAKAVLATGEHVDVELGPCNAQHCEVLAGLEEGTALGVVGGES